MGILNLFLPSGPAPTSGMEGLAALRKRELKAKLEADFAALGAYRSGLGRALEFFRSRPDLFPAAGGPEERMLSVERREALRAAWQGFLDRYLALDSIAKFYQSFHDLRNGVLRGQAFLLHYGAFVAEYSAALEFISIAEESPEADLLLNDRVPELGLPADTYAAFKLRFLNPVIASQFALLAVVHKYLGGESRPEVRRAIDEDADSLWRAGKGHGEVLTAANALRVLKKSAFEAWFPVQAGVSEWMGQTKVHRQGEALISRDQIRALLPRLRPGDILLQRREWYLSNVGLPGFWCHAALFVGTPEEREAFFDEPETEAWSKERGGAAGGLEGLLLREHPEAHALSARRQEDGNPSRVLEAIRLGVIFTSLEHSASADSMAVLRPRLSRRQLAQALSNAFRYVGRPYDFDFDFRTDSALVCSELVYKAFEPSEGFRGIRFPLGEVLGRLVCTANDMARLFDEEHDSAGRQMELVAFLDGREDLGSAVEAGAEEFRRSWRRPKWHVLVQGPPEPPPEEKT